MTGIKLFKWQPPRKQLIGGQKRTGTFLDRLGGTLRPYLRRLAMAAPFFTQQQAQALGSQAIRTGAELLTAVTLKKAAADRQGGRRRKRRKRPVQGGRKRRGAGRGGGGGRKRGIKRAGKGGFRQKTVKKPSKRKQVRGGRRKKKCVKKRGGGRSTIF